MNQWSQQSGNNDFRSDRWFERKLGCWIKQRQDRRRRDAKVLMIFAHECSFPTDLPLGRWAGGMILALLGTARVDAEPSAEGINFWWDVRELAHLRTSKMRQSWRRTAAHLPKMATKNRLIAKPTESMWRSNLKLRLPKGRSQLCYRHVQTS